ncbi:4-vinyl reductase 4VR [Methanocaldococcus infernus ME]|uniref:4-vinyl reductase 4VR n=1 Tax=Methanocaldococcus infernus (strain DSM 11812 / JCM 15783 / ME) TaxID=573063 RepID=D5VRI5_METIM|nr:V4R domain-containing protein [Methanocaldococcus infernus]ADG13188.1 4-vinyl reductase 4VR [Methanocaldococcus infernus ME]
MAIAKKYLNLESNKGIVCSIECILEEIKKTYGVYGCGILTNNGEILINKFPSSVSCDIISNLSIIIAIAEKMFLDTNNDIKKIDISGKCATLSIYPVGEFYLVLAVENNFKSTDILERYLPKLSELCLLLSENILYEDLPLEDLINNDKKISAFMFRILRFLNLKKYQNTNIDVLMYQLGNDISSYLKIDSFKKLKEFFESHGVGKLKILKEDGEKIISRVDECVTCSFINKNIGRTLCYFEGGLINGTASNIYKRKCETVETHCYGLGHSYCQFRTKIL